MKKKIVNVSIIVIALLVLFVIINQFDASLNEDIFTTKDVPAASLAKDNGFYLVWAMGEPPQVDITSDDVVHKYRKLFDTDTDYKAQVEKFAFKEYRQMYKTHYDADYRKLGLDFRIDNTKVDWCETVLANKPLFLPLAPNLQVIYNRMQMMIGRPVFQDFTTFEADAPLPNLLAWLHGIKLYTAANMITALEGDWETGVSNLLDQMDLGKRAVRGSRYLITNLISKAALMIPLEGLAALMNQRQCPASVYEMVLKRTPPLKFEEYGTSNSLKCEVLGFTFHFIDHPFFEGAAGPFKWLVVKLLLQENRTKNYADQFIKKFIEKEKTPPYLWESDVIDMEPMRSGIFWWLSNAGGKILLTAYNDYAGTPQKGTGLYAVIYKTYRKKALYDMLRISAELHLAYEPDKPVQEILEGLESYKTLMDPCSGQPYKWNDEKQLLYSIGADRTDNQGETLKYEKIEGSDYAMPVILYVK